MNLLLNPHDYDHGHDHDGGVDDHVHVHGHGHDDDDDGHGHGHLVKPLSAVCKGFFFFWFSLRCVSVCLDSRERVRNRSRKMRNGYREEIKIFF